jgi:predicted ATPase
MVLVTCGSGVEPADARGEHPLKRIKQNLLLRQLSIEMALSPLTRTAVDQLLTRELGHEMLPAGLTGFVHQHSEGNPLFAIAVVEHLISRRFLVREGTEGASGWKAAGSFEEMDAEVPERLAQMIELEIAGLSEEEQHILGAASLMGVAFPAWAVAAALNEDAKPVEEACDRLARRVHFVERGGQDELPGGLRSDFYVFVHGLYRDVLYRRQPSTRRAAWHLRIAEKLAAIFAGNTASVAREMAMHYEAAGEWLPAIGAMHSAARHARESLAYTEETQLLKDALRLAEKLSGQQRNACIREIRNDLMNASRRNGEGRQLRIVSGKA